MSCSSFIAFYMFQTNLIIKLRKVVLQILTLTTNVIQGYKCQHKNVHF